GSVSYGIPDIDGEVSRTNTTLGSGPDWVEKNDVSAASLVTTLVGCSFWASAELTRESLALQAVWASEPSGAPSESSAAQAANRKRSFERIPVLIVQTGR